MGRIAMPEFSQNIYSAVKIGISPFDDRSDGNQSGDQFPVNKVVDWIGIYSMVIRKPPKNFTTKRFEAFFFRGEPDILFSNGTFQSFAVEDKQASEVRASRAKRSTAAFLATICA